MSTSKRQKISTTYLYTGGRPDKGEGEGITRVIVQDGVLSIDDDAFYKWKDLVSVHIPSSVTRIEYRAFLWCTSLSSINLPTSLQYIGEDAFHGCVSISVMDLPDSLTDIGKYAFCGCSSLSSITIPSSMTRIQDGTFSDCRSLSQVIVSSSVIEIGDYAFARCSSLTSIKLPAPTSLQYIGESAFHGCVSISVMDLPDSLTDIGGCAFNECSSLSSITIPPSITRIQNGTFHNCRSMSQVIVSSSVIEIGDYAFLKCSSLTSIKLPTGIQTIGNDTFYHCNSLESIQVPPTITSIGNKAFLYCSSLKIAYVPSPAIDESYGIFDECDPHLIILTDVNGFEYGNLPTISLRNIHQCIQDLPNHDIPGDDQLDALHHVFHQRFPATANMAQESGFNLLHLLVYFPGVIYQPLSTLLTKCPQAAIAVGKKGKTALHHAITSTKHNMDVSSYNLLSSHSPDRVVHFAIQAGLHGDDLHEMVKAKTNALTLEDDESGLLPFMMAAENSNITGEESEKDLLFLTVSYELLGMDPSVLQNYI